LLKFKIFDKTVNTSIIIILDIIDLIDAFYAYGGAELQLQSFLALAIEVGNWVRTPVIYTIKILGLQSPPGRREKR